MGKALPRPPDWAGRHPTKISTTLSGETAPCITTEGTIGYRLIAEAGYNNIIKAGLKTSQIIETTTATSDYSPAVVVATSGDKVFHTC